MQFNYDKMENLLDTVKGDEYYCDSKPESVSDSINIVEVNFHEMYEIFFKKNNDLFIELYNEKKFSDFVRYFILCDDAQRYQSNLFNYTTRGWQQCIADQLKWRCENAEKDNIHNIIANIANGVTKNIIHSYA